MSGKIKTYPVVEVVWADHFIQYGDHDIEDVEALVRGPFLGRFTGYLVGDSKRMVAIASNVWQDGRVSDVMFIMKRAIAEMKVVSEGGE